MSAFNRWVKMTQLIPRSEFESEYAENFPTVMGLRAKSFRMGLGALIIKEKLGICDRPRVVEIRENPYLQYFIGQVSYCTAIAITFLALNLSTWWRRVFCVFLGRSGKTMSVFGFNIICGYIGLKLRESKLIFRLVWLVLIAVIIMKAIAPRLYAMLARSSRNTVFFHRKTRRKPLALDTGRKSAAVSTAFNNFFTQLIERLCKN